MLRASARLFEAVCSNATAAIFLMNERQECVYLNPAAEALTGFCLKEVQNKSLHEVIHHTRPDGRPYPIHECAIDRAFPQNQQEQGEEVFVHKNGTFYPVAYTASPIREEGTIVGTIIEVRSIQEEKDREKALKEEARALEVLNRTGVTLAAKLDLEEILQAVTDAATELAGAQFGAFFYNSTNADGEVYQLYTISGVGRDKFERFPMPRNTHVFGPTFRGDGPVRSEDITRDPRYGQNKPYNGMPEGHLPVRSYLAVPVVSRSGEVLGGLFFGHEKIGIFSERAERMVVGVAAQAAVAIDNSRLFQQAQAEISERRKAEEFQKLLNDELNHRVKNMLASVQGIARQTLRAAPAEEKSALEGRLLALSKAHSLVLREGPGNVRLRELAVQALEPFTGDVEAHRRLRIEGPEALLGPKASISLSLALHELATNATKHGALSEESGKISLTWALEEAEKQQVLRIRWQEVDGPVVNVPEARGFGSRLIERGLAHEFGGSTKLIFEPNGLICLIDLPARDGVVA
jgi:PAS domain S-box-containing protein